METETILIQELWLGPGADVIPVESRSRIPRALLAELYQSEATTRRHARRQARRLAETPPGRALEVVACHAAATLRALPDLAVQHGASRGRIARAVGTTLSLARQVIDPLLGQERAYRLTLLGIHHGLDVVRVMRNHAIDAGDQQLTGWCDSWLESRQRLANNAEIALLWFADFRAITAA